MPALRASALLAAKGINVSVINARFAKPLDDEMLMNISAETGSIVTIEENVLAGGFGSGVMEFFEERGIDHLQFCRIGIPDKFVEHGAPSKLREIYGLDAQGICAKVVAFLRFGENAERAVPRR